MGKKSKSALRRRATRTLSNISLPADLARYSSDSGELRNEKELARPDGDVQAQQVRAADVSGGGEAGQLAAATVLSVVQPIQLDRSAQE
jgi:hypothetical protein